MKAFKCGGACGRPDCDYSTDRDDRLQGHISSIKGTAAKKAAAPVPVPPEAGAAVPGEPSRYPGFKEWKPTTAAGAPAVPGAPVPPAPTPAYTPLETAYLWKGLGSALDGTIFKKASVKLDIDQAKANALDSAFKNAGFVSAPAAAPIVVPNWLPILIVILPIFIPPILSLLKDYMESRKEKKAADEREKEPAKESVPAKADSGNAPVPSQSSPAAVPQPYHDPRENG